MNTLLGQQITLCGTSLDKDVSKVTLHKDVLLLLIRVWVECNLYHFRLTIRVSREIVNLRTSRTEGYVVFFITCDGSDVETFNIIRSCLSVPINHVIDGAFIILFEHLYVEYALTNKDFVSYSDNLILTITVEDNHIIKVGTVLNELRLLKTRTDEALLLVDI